MALFTLTDITFNKEQSGPLTKLENSQGLGSDTNILKYPIDLGEYDKGHYMIIYINEQVNTSSEYTNPGSGVPTIQYIRELFESKIGATTTTDQLRNIVQGLGTASQKVGGAITGTELGQDLYNKAIEAYNKTGLPPVDEYGVAFNLGLDRLSGGNVNVQRTANYIGSITQALKSSVNTGTFLRKIRRTKQAIALYMPDTMTFAYNQTYNGTSVFDTLGKVGTALSAGSSIVDAVRAGGTQRDAINLASFGLQFLKDTGVGGDLANLGLAQLGVASNPGLELIYGSPSFRQFKFDFLFYPRSTKEAQQVQAIINSLKFYQAPEFASQTGGRFLVPPSEFDIEFFYNGKVNPNIPKISTCVLTGIDVDYAPNGWSTYEVPGQNASVGGTGMPVATRVSLSFTETQIVTKEYLRWAETGSPTPKADAFAQLNVESGGSYGGQ